MTRRAVTAVLLALAAAVTGCGVGAGESEGPQGVSLYVSRDFGAEEMGSAQADSVPEGETVMRLLQRNFDDVDTRHGGAFVSGIDGLSGGRSGGRDRDWFYYVNGIEADIGAAERKIADGDRVWWDHHDWTTAMRIPAVVGSFPEPFVSGVEGKRVPVRIDCAGGASERICDEVADRLHAAGVKAASQAGIGQAAGKEILRVVVGPWSAVRRDPTASLIGSGPQDSGVFARFDGTALELLDAKGDVKDRLTDAAGLVAATRFEEQAPTWVVTGTDDAGVAAAATAFEEGVLMNRFALAVVEGRGVPLPVRPEP